MSLYDVLGRTPWFPSGEAPGRLMAECERYAALGFPSCQPRAETGLANSTRPEAVPMTARLSRASYGKLRLPQKNRAPATTCSPGLSVRTTLPGGRGGALERSNNETPRKIGCSSRTLAARDLGSRASLP
jgi:hypothetical protein